MQSLTEPTSEAVEHAVNTPGVHYFHVEESKLATVRNMLYDALIRSTDFGIRIHTAYDKEKRSLRVAIT